RHRIGTRANPNRYLLTHSPHLFEITRSTSALFHFRSSILPEKCMSWKRTSMPILSTLLNIIFSWPQEFIKQGLLATPGSSSVIPGAVTTIGWPDDFITLVTFIEPIKRRYGMNARAR